MSAIDQRGKGRQPGVRHLHLELQAEIGEVAAPPRLPERRRRVIGRRRRAGRQQPADENELRRLPVVDQFDPAVDVPLGPLGAQPVDDRGRQPEARPPELRYGAAQCLGDPSRRHDRGKPLRQLGEGLERRGHVALVDVPGHPATLLIHAFPASSTSTTAARRSSFSCRHALAPMRPSASA